MCLASRRSVSAALRPAARPGRLLPVQPRWHDVLPPGLRGHLQKRLSSAATRASRARRPGEVKCGRRCCPKGQKCRNGKCCKKCGDKKACCIAGETCCRDTCCKAKEKCCVPPRQDDVLSARLRLRRPDPRRRHRHQATYAGDLLSAGAAAHEPKALLPCGPGCPPRRGHQGRPRPEPLLLPSRADMRREVLPARPDGHRDVLRREVRGRAVQPAALRTMRQAVRRDTALRERRLRRLVTLSFFLPPRACNSPELGRVCVDQVPRRAGENLGDTDAAPQGAPAARWRDSHRRGPWPGRAEGAGGDKLPSLQEAGRTALRMQLQG